MKQIRRDFYLDQLTSAINTPDIKVLTGIRRSGKSKLLEALKAHIQQTQSNANIIHINYNLLEFDELRDYRSLHNYVEKAYKQGMVNYLLIDEVQMCTEFERAINSFHASEKFDIFITGSNAFLLSSDLATLFTGRTFSIEVFPFSLKEFMTYYELKDTDEALDRYLLEGGMAGSYAYHNQAAKYSYISDVIDTLIFRDIQHKYNVRNIDILTKLEDYLLDNISNITSARKIADALNRGGGATNDKTIGAYLLHLTNAFAFYRTRRFDLKGKRYLSSGDKYYLADHSFRYAKLGTRNIDYGRAYENMVAIDLMRRGYEVYAGVLYKKEIDFVAIKQSEKFYIQVSDDISSPETFKREYEPLLAIKDAFPKLIISRTHHDMHTYEGIEIHDLGHWLKREE